MKKILKAKKLVNEDHEKTEITGTEIKWEGWKTYIVTCEKICIPYRENSKHLQKIVKIKE